ncbi:DUF1266 domain-containing protein [Corynebacterium guangdongense]|uniref:DUF1266 domain-containing protein n=1 Tax=Corynebacterium guangdongense TaxID=1783348 RepID=A0ABU1ZZT6_9CORY|nr:DUF1266 domain-containing protein [Corynebacterium guangdongense]MDR7329772.1 hypothetical protein [Corynebacterium guangdongense]
MHPFIAFTDEHSITTYEEFLHHPLLLTNTKFQRMMPSYLLWSNALDGQLQRGFAASVPMATVLDARYVDGPDKVVEPKGWLSRTAGNCEYTGLTALLKKSWGIETKADLMSNIGELATKMEEQVLAYDVLHPEIVQVAEEPRPQRAAKAAQLEATAVARGRDAGMGEGFARRWWDKLTAPFLEDIADLALPPAKRLPRTLLAWNIKRLSVLAWAGTRVGLATVTDVEPYLRAMTVMNQERYRDWREFQDAYHLARRYWIGDTEKNFDDQIAGAWMLRHGHSPWVILPLRGNNSESS